MPSKLADEVTAISVVNFIVLAAALVVALGVIWRQAIRPLIHALETARLVSEEFQPNHGESLRDAIDRIERKVDEMIEEGKKEP